MKTKLLTVFVFLALLLFVSQAFAWNESCTNGSGKATEGNLTVYLVNCDYSFKNSTPTGVSGLPFSITQVTTQAISLVRSLVLENAITQDNEQNVSFPPLSISGITINNKTGQSSSLSQSQGMSQNMEYSSTDNMNFDTDFVFWLEKVRFGRVSTYKTYAVMDYLYFNLYMHQKYDELNHLINLFLLSTSNLSELINYKNITAITPETKDAIVAAYEMQAKKQTKQEVLQTIAISTILGSPNPYQKDVTVLKKIVAENIAKIKKEQAAKKAAITRAKTFGVIEKILGLVIVILIGVAIIWLLKKKVKITFNK